MTRTLAAGSRFHFADGTNVFRTLYAKGNGRGLAEDRPGLSSDNPPRPTQARKMTVPDREAAIRAEERSRLSTIFASKDVVGREAAAVELLVESNMSGEKIVAMLPKLHGQADHGRLSAPAAMRGHNPDLGNRGGKQPSTVTHGNHGWGKITAKVNASNSGNPDPYIDRGRANHGWSKITAKVNASGLPR